MRAQFERPGQRTKQRGKSSPLRLATKATASASRKREELLGGREHAPCRQIRHHVDRLGVIQRKRGAERKIIAIVAHPGRLGHSLIPRRGCAQVPDEQFNDLFTRDAVKRLRGARGRRARKDLRLPPW